MQTSNIGQRVQHQQKFTIDHLVDEALRFRSGYPAARCTNTWFCDQQKNAFQDVILRSAKIAGSKKPAQELSKIQVDVNEKIYTNNGRGRSRDAGSDGPGGDKSTVKIVKTTEVSNGYNYEQQTSSGIEWGAGTNVGAQFGLPQVGVGVSVGASASFKKTNMNN